jgi:hypothetical protein
MRTEQNRTELKDDQSGSLASKQESLAIQALIVITFSFAGATAALTFVASQIASNIQQRQNPLNPPSSSMMAIVYFLALASLLGAVLWTRSRTSDPSLPYKDFQQRTMVGLALANVSEYLAVFWVVLGGGFTLSLPLFAGSALVTLLFILPGVLRRKSALSERSSFDSGQRR